MPLIIVTTKGARINVPTDLKVDNWRALCGNYEDQILLQHLEFGFPLCLDRSKLVFNTDVANRSSVSR